MTSTSFNPLGAPYFEFYISERSLWTINTVAKQYKRTPRDGNFEGHPMNVDYHRDNLGWCPYTQLIVWTREECEQHLDFHNVKYRLWGMQDDELYLWVENEPDHASPWVETIVHKLNAMP
jgi:hypothetical protein